METPTQRLTPKKTSDGDNNLNLIYQGTHKQLYIYKYQCNTDIDSTTQIEKNKHFFRIS